MDPDLLQQFRARFEAWNLALPDRPRGKIVAGGWTIWFLHGEDHRGEFLDYYAVHRMTDDDHVRLRPQQGAEALPAMQSLCYCGPDLQKAIDAKAAFHAHNAEVARLMESKGFVADGNEPGHVLINQVLRTKVD